MPYIFYFADFTDVFKETPERIKSEQNLTNLTYVSVTFCCNILLRKILLQLKMLSRFSRVVSFVIILESSSWQCTIECYS